MARLLVQTKKGKIKSLEPVMRQRKEELFNGVQQIRNQGGRQFGLRTGSYEWHLRTLQVCQQCKQVSQSKACCVYPKNARTRA
jgi:hypothetical protein